MDIPGKIKNALATFRTKFREDLERDNGLYWQMSNQDGRIQDQSHWRGSRRWHKDRWHDYGDFHWALLSRYLLKYGEPEYYSSLHMRISLEWGCGGGANVRPLCHNHALVYGTEVSAPTLDECEHQIKSLGYNNFRKVLFQSEKPESVLDSIEDESVDLILSVAVFQHFPSKAYTEKILVLFNQLLKKNGFALIQVRYSDGSEKMRQKESDYARNVIYMTSFTREEFSNQLLRSGFTILSVERDIDNARDQHDYYFVRK
jgi:2-polyprenyl-3-methyl-5-hydroxy-6-metoxy-1,4-benzoquinol methylase